MSPYGPLQKPPEHRTQTHAENTFKLTIQLAKGLPQEEAARALSRLEALRVRVIELAAVPHRMIYDKQTIAAEAGRRLEIRFSNADNMPHNFALVQPGSLQQVGMLAEARSLVGLE